MRLSCGPLASPSGHHGASCCKLLCFTAVRAPSNLATGQIEEQEIENKGEADKTNQCKRRVTVTDHLAVAFARAKNVVDQPRLTAKFCRHPAQSIGNVGKWECQQNYPEQPSGGHEPLAPNLKCCVRRQRDEHHPEGDHEVIRVIQELNIVRPDGLRILVESVHVALECAIGKETEGVRKFDRVIQPPCGHIRLADDCNTSPRTSFKFPFHGCKSYRLILCDHL